MSRRFYHPPPAITCSHVALLFAMLIVATIIDWIDAARTEIKKRPL